MGVMKKLFGCFCFALLMSLFGLSSKPIFASAHTPPLIKNSLSLSAESHSSFQVAGIYWLPDYLKDNTSRDYNTDGDNEDPGGGDVIPSDPINPDESRCSIYGFQTPDSVDTSLYSCTTVYPITGLPCYKDCVCKSDFKYTEENCLASAGKKLSGRNCNGKYENCVCKQTVTVSTGEKCDLYCENACVEKSCKPSVSLGTGEECSEHCASSSGTCTAKKCKASVSYNTSKGEYCAEKCASNSGVCTKKGCNKICKDKFTGSAPTNGYITTENCSDCSGSYTIKTGWACNSGYHKSGSSCIADCTRTCYDSYTGSLPANAQYTTKSCSDCSGSYTIKTGWSCKSGYTKSGNSCVCATTCKDKVTTKPANSYFVRVNCYACGVSKTINDRWECDSGYKKSGTSCVSTCTGGAITLCTATYCVKYAQGSSCWNACYHQCNQNCTFDGNC